MNRNPFSVSIQAAKTATGAKMAKLKHSATKNNRWRVLMRSLSLVSLLIRSLCADSRFKKMILFKGFEGLRAVNGGLMKRGWRPPKT